MSGTEFITAQQLYEADAEALRAKLMALAGGTGILLIPSAPAWVKSDPVRVFGRDVPEPTKETR